MISLAEPAAGPPSTDLVQQVAEFFSPTGPLSAASAFEYRPQQQEMAVAVARALTQGEHLVVRQAQARFSAPMVPQGRGDAPAPVSVRCGAAGNGYWRD